MSRLQPFASLPLEGRAEELRGSELVVRYLLLTTSMPALDDLGWAGTALAGWAACCARTATAVGCDGAGTRWPKGVVDVAEGA
jgi:hypothetical protein